MSNPIYSVLTALGADRIGIVDDITHLLASRGGNVESSKMAVLGGEFAAILLVALPEEAVPGLEASLEGLGRDLGLRLELKRTSPPRRAKAAEGRPYRLESVSLDSPGVAQAIASLLKRHHINIEELETMVTPAPWTGAPMFRLEATVILEAGVSLPQLKADLADLEAKRDLDITLRPVFPAKAE